MIHTSKWRTFQFLLFVLFNFVSLVHATLNSHAIQIFLSLSDIEHV